MAKGEKLDRKQLIEVIQAKKGMLTQVALSLNVSLQTIYNYRNRYATVAAAIEEARDELDSSLLDGAEYKLAEAVRNGESWAIKYVLDKKGQGRGYEKSSTLKVSDPDGGPLGLGSAFSGLTEGELAQLLNNLVVAAGVSLPPDG
jgi:hypothetical protein